MLNLTKLLESWIGNLIRRYWNLNLWISQYSFRFILPHLSFIYPDGAIIIWTDKWLFLLRILWVFIWYISGCWRLIMQTLKCYCWWAIKSFMLRRFKSVVYFLSYLYFACWDNLIFTRLYHLVHFMTSLHMYNFFINRF